MDVRQLSALVAIADHRGFSAAARALHTVQSNISSHVARLERELGVTLVDRASATLTPEGEAVVERARRIQTELEALVSDVAAVHSEVAGTTRIGVIGTTARWLVPPLLEAMAAAYPAVQIVVVDATTTSLLPQVANGRLDLGVIALPAADPDVDTEPLFDEDLVVVAPAGHALAARDRVTLPEVAEYDLLLEPKGTAFRDDLDAQARAAGIVLHTRAELDGMRLVASLAFEGFAPAVLPASAVVESSAPTWQRVQIDGVTRRTVGLAWRRRGLPSAATRAIRGVLTNVVAEQVPRHPGLYLDHA